MATPSQLASWRSKIKRNSNIYFILHLDFGSQEYWFSTDSLSIQSTAKGTYLSVWPGLITQLNYQRAFDFLNRSENIPSFSVEVWNKESFQLLRDKYPLTNTACEISLWIDGLTWEERLIVIQGSMRSPSWNLPSDPFSFSILSQEKTVDREFPPLKVDTVKFPDADTKAIGEPYPIGYGSGLYVKCPYISTVNYKYLVFGHPVYAAPLRTILKGYDNISRQEVFSSECAATTDFDCTTGGAGTWSAGSGIVSFTNDANASGRAWLIDSSGNHIKSYNQLIKSYCAFTAEADTASYISFIFRYKDSNNFYVAYVSRITSGPASNMAISKYVGGVETVLGTIAITTVDLNQWFEFDLRIDGNKITAYFDQEEIISVEDASFPVSGDTALYIYHATAGSSAVAGCHWVHFPVSVPSFSNATDASGNAYYMADFSDNLGSDTEVWVQGYGKKDSNNALIENPSDVIKDIITSYTALSSVDDIGFAKSKSSLLNWKFSGVFQGSGSTSGTAFGTINDRLIKETPCIMTWIEQYPTLITLDYDRQDVSLYLDKDRNFIRFDGNIQETPIENVFNSITVKYCHDPLEQIFSKSISRDKTNNGRCAVSEGRYGKRDLVIEAYDIQDDQTAGFLLDWLVRLFADVTLTFKAICTKDVLQKGIEQNDIYYFTNSDQSWTNKKCVIQGITINDDNVSLDTIVIPD